LKRFVRYLVPCFSVSLVLAACGSGDSEVGESSFSVELVHAVCDTVVNCCNDAELGFNATTCKQTVLGQFGDRSTSTGVRYDATEAANCVESSRRLSASCVTIPPTVCSNVFRGLLPPGSPCQESYQCDPGPQGYGVCGTTGVCEWPARGTVGALCAYSCRSGPQRAECRNVYGGPPPVQTTCFEDDGLFCFVNPGGQGDATCQPISADCRQRMDKDKACPPGGYCDGASGVCLPYAPVGGSCAAAQCVPEGFCANGVCYPKQPVPAACTDRVQCLSDRCNGGFCTMYSAAAVVMCAGN